MTGAILRGVANIELEQIQEDIEFLNYLRKEGNCSGIENATAIFFPDSETGYWQAMRICSDCPVRDECAEWALAQGVTKLYGVWGGLTEGWRKIITKGRKSKNVAPVKEHGKGWKSFKQHLKRGELPCDECHAGWTKEFPIKKIPGKQSHHFMENPSDSHSL